MARTFKDFERDYPTIWAFVNASAEGWAELRIGADAERLLAGDPTLSENRAREIAACWILADWRRESASLIIEAEAFGVSGSDQADLCDFYDARVIAIERGLPSDILVRLTGTRTLIDDLADLEAGRLPRRPEASEEG